MGKWSRDEIDGAFKHFMDVTDRRFLAGDSADLEEWVQCFTEDVTFRPADGSAEKHGRDAVRDWIYRWSDSFLPNTHPMKFFPVPWYIVDEERGWVVCEWMNTMEDPGDGSIHAEKVYSRLMYAGNNQWSFEEDIGNPMLIRDMMSEWMKAKIRCLGEAAECKDIVPAETC